MSTNTWFTRTVLLMLCVSAGILLRLSWGGSYNRASTRGLLMADMKEPASTNATADANPRQDESQTDIVIVLAYYRSGSTFLAEIFNQNPEAVYFFEPLRWFRESFFNETFYIYPGNTRRLGPMGTVAPEKQAAFMVDVLKKLIHCDIEHLPKSVYFLNMNMRIWPFCNPEQKNLKDMEICFKSIGDSSDRCTDILKKVCTRFSFKAFKVIRLPLNDLDPILGQYPNAKVIHLIRDPRGSINSQRWLSEYCGLECAVHRHCNEHMLPDLISRRTLEKRYPGRILQVIYEDVVEDPVLWSHRIYTFLGRTMPGNIESWLKRATKAESDNGTWGTKRRNALETAHRWKTDMPLKMALQVDAICADVLKLLPMYEPAFRILRQQNVSNANISKT